MASYSKQSKKWYVRIRRAGQKISKGGFDTKTAAKDWAKLHEDSLRVGGPSMMGMGPMKTSLALGLRDYACNVLTKQAGCVQALSRVNKYLRAAGLPTLRATKVRGGRVFDKDKQGNILVDAQKTESVLFELHEEGEAAVLFQGARQKGFASRAQSNKAKNEAPQGVRERLARMPVASIGSHHLQELLNQMDTVGYAGATRRQEIAILSAFFTYAMNIWNWSLPANPALKIEWPTGNERERILTEDETVRLATHLANCGNKPFQIYVLLAMETAMRRGEMLWTMCWCDIDRHAVDGDVLKLPTAKAGRRDVPLTPYALELLGQLPHGEAHERIFDMTEAALENAWKRVCEKAGIVDLHIHDLRRCSATNYAKLLDGNIFSLQKITGHRTLEKLRTYVNLSARDVAKQLRKIPQQTIAQTMQQTMADARSQKIPKARVRKGARPEDGDTGTASGRVYDFGAFRTQALGRAKAGG